MLPAIGLFCLFLLPALVLCSAILFTTGGHFTYTLDAPYIHLALARNIWHGSYGINPGSGPLHPAAFFGLFCWPRLHQLVWSI